MDGQDSGKNHSTAVGAISSQIDRFNKLAGYQGTDRVVTWPEYLKNQKEHIGKGIALSTGFAELDSLTKGFQTGELVTISGYTGMGKTLFLKSMIRSFGIGKVPVTVFCYEDAVERYLEMFEQENATYPIFVPMTLQTGNLQWLEERIVESKLKYNSRVFTIDHLHYLMDMGHGKENTSLRIGSIMRFLKKQMAEEHNMLGFLVAHQEKVKENQEASIDTIRDSSLIGQESDNVIIVQRLPDDKDAGPNDATYESGYAMVKVDKARRAGTFRKRLLFQKSGNWLSPV